MQSEFLAEYILFVHWCSPGGGEDCLLWFSFFLFLRTKNCSVWSLCCIFYEISIGFFLTLINYELVARI